MSLRATLFAVAASTALAFGIAPISCSSPPTDSNRSTGTTTSTTGGSGGSGNQTTTGPGTTTDATATGTGGGATSTGTGGSATGTGGSGTGGGATGTGGSGTGGGATGTGGRGGTAGSGGAGGAPTGCGACPSGVVGHCDSGATYPTYPGFTLQLAEDFCTPLNLDTDPVWTWSDGAPADGDTWFRKEQISFANGNMSITAIPMTLPANYTSFSESDYMSATGKPTGRHFVSGEMRTKYNNYRYGRYEARFKSPTANPNPMLGGYISDLFVFRTPKWTTWNEVDVELEPMDGTTSIIRQVSGNVVYLQNPGAGVPGYPGGAAFDAMPTGVANYIQTETHTYAFEWTSTKVTWYLDGNVIHSYMYPASGGNPPNAGGNFPHIPNLSSKIMMNLWVFAGTHFGDPSQNMYPLTSVYEYFRFYKATGETYPCTPTPTCLQAADTAFSKNNVNETVYP